MYLAGELFKSIPFKSVIYVKYSLNLLFPGSEQQSFHSAVLPEPKANSLFDCPPTPLLLQHRFDSGIKVIQFVLKKFHLQTVHFGLQGN